MKFDILYLWYLGDPTMPRYVGELNRVADGKGVSLRYAPQWLAKGFPLSEDMPLIDTEHLPRGRLSAGQATAVGAVDDARPDRWGERVIEYVDKPARRSLMEYLYYAGDDRFGALGTSTSAAMYQPRPGGPLPRLDQAQQLSEIVHKINNRDPITEIERKVIASGGSFGGAKPKALIEIDGAEWVIKFFNNEPVDVPLVEHASMTLARQAGINTAETQVVPLAGEHAVVVRRFDRKEGKRVHSISVGTALRASTTPDQLSLGYPALAQLLRRAGVAAHGENEQDSKELFRRMVFNILLDNTDDHEKNHALMDVGPGMAGRYRLAPAYDVLPTNSGQGMQEFICGDQGRDSTLENAMSQCVLFGLTPEEAALEVARVIDVVNGWREHFESCGVTTRDIESLAVTIDDSEIGRIRKEFDAEQYRGRHAKPRLGRRGAFQQR